MNTSDTILVWHRNDLRIRDNPALSQAAADGTPVPMFVFDPRFYESRKVSDGRIEFLHESLTQLDSQYSQLGGSLCLEHGSPERIIRQLLDTEAMDRVYFNASPTAGYARKRDNRMSKQEGVRCLSDDGIVRSGDSRDGWRHQATDYFESRIRPSPETVGTVARDGVTIEQIEDTYSVSSQKDRRHSGGCKRAQTRLQEFIDNIGTYPGGISAPADAEKKTSQLSPYFKFGCVSQRDAYTQVTETGQSGRGVEMFKSRLYWNRHFTQKLQDNKTLRKNAINPVFRGMNRNTHDDDKLLAWKNGLTGYPMVDASMRALTQTGWMNFRMRALCASFYTYILRCYWEDGADWYYRHLLDADPAINYAQWQMQSGLVGVHPLRIYNPRKQVRDNDPDGEYIKKYVPELKELPSQYLDEPEKTPLTVQDECGVSIGDDYPYPVVDFEKQSKRAREKWASLDDRAKEALEDPEVFRRASLSEGRDRTQSDDTADKTDGQTRLGDF